MSSRQLITQRSPVRVNRALLYQSINVRELIFLRSRESRLTQKNFEMEGLPPPLPG